MWATEASSATICLAAFITLVILTRLIIHRLVGLSEIAPQDDRCPRKVKHRKGQEKNESPR